MLFTLKVKKKIPYFIEEYLSPMALTIWIINDGGWISNRGIKIATNCYNLSDVKRLSSILENKYGLSVAVHSAGAFNQYTIYLPKNNLPLLVPIVQPPLKSLLFIRRPYNFLGPLCGIELNGTHLQKKHLTRSYTNTANSLKLHPQYITDFVDASKNKSTALVLWRVNLQSMVGEKFTRNQLAIVKLPACVKEVLIGLILSDNWLTFSSSPSKNARLGFKQSITKSNYIFIRIWYIISLLF